MDKKYYLRAKGRSALEKISDLESQGFDVPSSLKRAAENAANFQGNIKTEKQLISYHKKLDKLNYKNIENKAKLTVDTGDDTFKVNLSYKKFRDEGDNAVDKKLNYYTKLENKLQAQITKIEEDSLSAYRERNLASGLNTTIHDIRNEIDDDDARKLFYAGVFSDEDEYFNEDFRDVLIKHGFTKLAESLSQRLGYGSLDDYINNLEAEADYSEEYYDLKSKLVAASAKRQALEQLRWSNGIWGNNEGFSGSE